LEQFSDLILEVSHGGSTSVPGMVAKPIIDMFAALTNLDDYKKIKVGLEKLHYEYRGEEGVPGRQLFVKGSGERRTHHLQLTTRDNDQWKNHILLREYYVRHPVVVEQYITLKKELAKKYANDRRLYSNGKSAFIASILEKAQKAYIESEI